MGDLDIRLMRRLLRLLPDDATPDSMAERLMEMYRQWWGKLTKR